VRRRAAAQGIGAQVSAEGAAHASVEVAILSQKSGCWCTGPWMLLGWVWRL